MATKKVEAHGRKEVRIGMLGAGFMGKCHTNAYKKIPYIYTDAGISPRLLVLCDKDEPKVRQQAARYGYEEYCTDWKDVVSDPRIEVFDNCGPDPVHPEPCIAALNNGKNVICEKPMAISVADARRMRDAAAASSGRAMCVFNYRFMPAVQLAKELIASGEIGTVYHMRVQYMQMAGHDPSLPADKVWYSAWPHSGGLQGIGSHAIDQCRFLLGEIKSVSALVRTFNPDRAVPSAGCPEVTADEGVAAVLEFARGAIGVMESSVVATGRKNFLVWEINASKGSLKWDLEHPNSLFACLARPGDAGLLGVCRSEIFLNAQSAAS
jgi:predicted dehydrogenase